MLSRATFLGWAILIALVAFALPAQAQIKMEDLGFQNKTIEPGAGVLMSLGNQTGSAGLGDGVVVFKFKITDIDPIADDMSDVNITCVLIQQLGTATLADIEQVMLMDQDSNGLALGAPTVAGSTAAADPGALPGCESMARTDPNAPMKWEIYFNDLNPTLVNPQGFIIPDDGMEEFQVAVRIAETDRLLDDSQNHTIVLKATFQIAETVGSPPNPTIFVDPVTDSAPEVIWNGGINSFTEDTWVVNPLMPGETGVVSRFTICDDDADEDQLILRRFFVRQDEFGTANSSDLVSLDLYRVEGFTRTLVGSRTPDATFERGSGATPGLTIPGGADTAITVPDDTCMTFELEAQVSPFAFKGHTIAPRISIRVAEPFETIINETVEPELRSNFPTMIGKGIIVLPDTNLIGKPGIVPLKVAGVQLPGMGTLQVGPNGKLQYDPNVINIKAIRGVGPYVVDAVEIDNRRGEARFTVRIDPAFDANGDGRPDNPLLTAFQDGTVANLHVEPTGKPADRTRLVLTFDCFELVDQMNCIPQGFPNAGVPNQNPNNDISVSAGEVTLLHPGDVDFDGAPTISDALKIANALLSCTDGTSSTNNNNTSTTSFGFSTVGERVIWTNDFNVNIFSTANGNDLVKNAGGTGFNAGASSIQALTSGDGFVEVTVDETNTDRLFGLSRGDTDRSEGDIDFAVFLRSNGRLEVRLNGSSRVPNPAVSYSSGDVIRVEIDGSNVLFKRNGSTFHTENNVVSSSSYPLLVDTSLSTNGATISGALVRSLSTTNTNNNNTTSGNRVVTDLTDEQLSAGDVAAPFAGSGQIPDCSSLTSADVAEIARLAINFGTSPAPSAMASSAATANVDKPWYSFVTEFIDWITGNSASDSAVLRLDTHVAAQQLSLSVENVPGTALGGVQGTVGFNPMTTQVRSVRGVNGYSVLAFDVDNALGEIRFVALAPKGKGIHNGQILKLDVTSSGAMQSALSVTALVDEDALAVPFALKGNQALNIAPSALSVNQVQALSVGDGFRFQALGTGIEGIQVQVYNLGGAKVFDQQADGNALGFHALTDKGQPLANGVYLYVITAKGANGEQIRSAVNKLAILR